MVGTARSIRLLGTCESAGGQAAPAARQPCSVGGPGPPGVRGRRQQPRARGLRPAGVGRVAGGDAGHGADALHLQHPAGRTALLCHACHIAAMAPALSIHRRCCSAPDSALPSIARSPKICSKRRGTSLCASRTTCSSCVGAGHTTGDMAHFSDAERASGGGGWGLKLGGGRWQPEQVAWVLPLTVMSPGS